MASEMIQRVKHLSLSLMTRISSLRPTEQERIHVYSPRPHMHHSTVHLLWGGGSKAEEEEEDPKFSSILCECGVKHRR